MGSCCLCIHSQQVNEIYMGLALISHLIRLLQYSSYKSRPLCVSCVLSELLSYYTEVQFSHPGPDLGLIKLITLQLLLCEGMISGPV